MFGFSCAENDVTAILSASKGYYFCTGNAPQKKYQLPKASGNAAFVTSALQRLPSFCRCSPLKLHHSVTFVSDAQLANDISPRATLFLGSILTASHASLIAWCCLSVSIYVSISLTPPPSVKDPPGSDIFGQHCALMQCYCAALKMASATKACTSGLAELLSADTPKV